MAAHELCEAGPDAVLMAQRKLLLGDQLVMKQIGLEQRTRVRDRGLVLDHALLEARLRSALAPTHVSATGFERWQQAASAKHDHMRHAIRILERDADGRTTGRGVA